MSKRSGVLSARYEGIIFESIGNVITLPEFNDELNLSFSQEAMDQKTSTAKTPVVRRSINYIVGTMQILKNVNSETLFIEGFFSS